MATVNSHASLGFRPKGYERMGAQMPPRVGGGDHPGAPISEEDRALFVEFLVAARRRSGRSLDEITTITKVPARHLEALEQGRVELLPAGLYRRSIVRNYARAVGLDPAVALERFGQFFGVEAVLPEFQGIPGIPSTPHYDGVLRQAIALAPVAAARLQSFRTIANPARMLTPLGKLRQHVGVLAIAAAIGVAVAITALFVLDGTRPSDEAAPAAAVSPANTASTPPALLRTQPAALVTSGSSVSQPPAPTTRQPDAGAAPGAAVPAVLDAAARAQPPSTVGPDTPASETRLLITSQPAGGRVTVNGIGWGVTPVTIRHLPPGDKLVRVTKDGYVAQERLVRLGEQGGSHSVALILRERD
jgi:hypothetical protein